MKKIHSIFVSCIWKDDNFPKLFEYSFEYFYLKWKVCSKIYSGFRILQFLGNYCMFLIGNSAKHTNYIIASNVNVIGKVKGQNRKENVRLSLWLIFSTLLFSKNKLRTCVFICNSSYVKPTNSQFIPATKNWKK